MSIVRGEPLGELQKMRGELDRFFENLLPRRWFRGLAAQELELEPAVEMFETDGEVVVRAALPNIDPKQVDITVTIDAITLKGETKREEERKERNYYHRELRYGAFLRTLPFRGEVKSAEATATYKDGVLEVKVPKSERAKATSVKVKVE